MNTRIRTMGWPSLLLSAVLLGGVTAVGAEPAEPWAPKGLEGLWASQGFMGHPAFMERRKAEYLASKDEVREASQTPWTPAGLEGLWASQGFVHHPAFLERRKAEHIASKDQKSTPAAAPWTPRGLEGLWANQGFIHHPAFLERRRQEYQQVRGDLQVAR